jgi:vacuolar-type H+-ATPase subunit C/Vma6
MFTDNYQNKNLLMETEDRGYPTAYLLARIRGRRVHLIKDWDSIILDSNPLEAVQKTRYGEYILNYTNEGIWRLLQSEFQWMYLQMNNWLRDIFQPFFTYYELRTVIMCLRFKLDNSPDVDMADLLSFSLLSTRIKKLIKTNENITGILNGMSKKFFPSTYKPDTLHNIFSEKGLKGIEEELTDEYIERIRDRRLHSIIRKFFAYLIDIRNLLILFKYTRWNMTSEPVFFRGGSISTPRLRKALNTGKASIMNQLIYERTGKRLHEPGALSIENVLLSDLTKRLRHAGRDSDIGFILDYLWKMYIEARNLSIIIHGRVTQKEAIRGELVTV